MEHILNSLIEILLILLMLSLTAIMLNIIFHKKEKSPINTPAKIHERQQLDIEIDEFLSTVRNRLPEKWDLGEGAWYESIRRREAEIYGSSYAEQF